MVLFGVLPATNPIWVWAAPIVSGLALAVTGGLLIWDLEHPERFYLIFTRPQWRSWLVKGAFVVAGYSLVLLLHFIASLAGMPLMQKILMIPGLPLGTLTAVYTAYLFAQAKARDMWQNPLLPPHLLVQAVLLGSAVMLLLFTWLKGQYAPYGYIDVIRPEILNLYWILGISSLLHLLMIWGEVSLTHATAHARLAVWEMVRGRYTVDFWHGIGLSFLGGVLPWLAVLGYVNVALGVVGAPLALVGMVLYENAYVQAGQSVPLA